MMLCARLESKIAEVSYCCRLSYADDVCDILDSGQHWWLLSKCVSPMTRLRDPLGVFSRELSWYETSSPNVRTRFLSSAAMVLLVRWLPLRLESY